MRIEICVGSSCHLKGAYHLVKAFQQYIELNKLHEKVTLELAGSFCQEQCIKGVVVKIDDQVFTRVVPENIPDFFPAAITGGESVASHYNPESSL